MDAPRSRRFVPRAALLAGLILAGPAAAADPADADWPCIQRLVPELTSSQMWAGPAPDDALGDDAEVAAVAFTLASRKTPLDQTDIELDRFAEGLQPDVRNEKLTQLFHNTLELINQERAEIIDGIMRYTRKQRRLADKITQDSQQLRGLQPGVPPDAATRALLDAREWDLRVYRDRERVLRQICEQPVLLDQRAFALARAVQSRLAPN